MLAHPRNLATCSTTGWISAYAGELSACLRSFPFRKELGRPRMVVPTGAVVCGRADGLHWPIERFSCEWFNRRIRDDPPYQSLRLEI